MPLTWPTIRASATVTVASAHKDEIEAIIAAWAAERDAEEIDRLMAEAGVPCGRQPYL